MERRALLSLIAHRATCAIAATAFVSVAARHLVLSGEFGPVVPFHTTNRFLASTIHSRAGSERLLEVFQSLPQNEPVAVMYHDDAGFSMFVAYVVIYFAWPRKVQGFPVKRENLASQMQALANAPVSAAFFCGVEPPPGTEPIFRIGQGLSLSTRATPQAR